MGFTPVRSYCLPFKGRAGAGMRFDLPTMTLPSPAKREGDCGWCLPAPLDAGGA